ncbi:MAG: hypothetical protein IJ193_02995 [Bacilli bacterium]|nr:hypothetical protein [Bacilli bacterium]
MSDIEYYIENHLEEHYKPFTVLTSEELNGFFPKDITEAKVTDFAVLTGANITKISGEKGYYFGDYFAGRFFDPFQTAIYSSEDKRVILGKTYARDICCRPAILFDRMDVSPINRDLIHRFGEYPQWVAENSNEMLKEFDRNPSDFIFTGSYTNNLSDSDEVSFIPKELKEYQYQGEKYVLMENQGKSVLLSDGHKYHHLDRVFVKVSPIEWIYNPNKNALMSKYLLFSNVSYLYDMHPKTMKFNRVVSRFDESCIYDFMNKYFLSDIIFHTSFKKVSLEEKKEETNSEIIEDPYVFDYSSKSEEEIIRGLIDADVSIMIHGKSSDGKSSRVQELDPECEIIYMRNATPESLNGISVYHSKTGRMIDVPPSWYEHLVARCEKEPDKIHLVFFDELNNATPTIQGMAFNIILDKEINGKWELPKNARIVAAGNEVADSIAANELVEPLYNRFAHVYVDTKINDWLKWAVHADDEKELIPYIEKNIPHKIHPAIMAFIASNRDALRTEFTGERPNADPRKWEMASRVLYQTNQADLLKSLIGEDLSKQFSDFWKSVDSSKKKEITNRYENLNIDELVQYDGFSRDKKGKVKNK